MALTHCVELKARHAESGRRTVPLHMLSGAGRVGAVTSSSVGLASAAGDCPNGRGELTVGLRFCLDAVSVGLFLSLIDHGRPRASVAGPESANDGRVVGLPWRRSCDRSSVLSTVLKRELG